MLGDSSMLRYVSTVPYTSSVFPAKAGIQKKNGSRPPPGRCLGPGLRRGDGRLCLLQKMIGIPRRTRDHLTKMVGPFCNIP